MNTNEKLGLPHGNMKKAIFMFDVDGTLISNTKEPYHPNEQIRTMLIILSSFKNITVGVWSGGGEMHARNAVRYLGLQNYVKDSLIMGKIGADLSKYENVFVVDDMQDTALGDFAFIVREK